MTTLRARTLLHVLAAAATLSTGCATIVARGPDTMAISSNPSGAAIRIDDKPVGTTPANAHVERSAKIVTLRKEGYEEAIRPVPRELNPWVFGNIAIGGLIGLVVDASTGNAEMAADTLFVELRPAPAVADGRIP